MIRYWESVKDFTAANGQVYHSERPVLLPGTAVAILRMRLMQEELGELSTALHERKLADSADGFADLLYVVYGAAVAYGVVINDDEGPGEYDALAARSARRLAILNFQVAAASSLAATAIAIMEYSCICDAGHDKSNEHRLLGDELRGFIAEIKNGAADLGLPLRELFVEVHRSNMTKSFTPTTPGAKYGEGGGKGPNYSPPDILGMLKAAGLEPGKDGWR